MAVLETVRKAIAEGDADFLRVVNLPRLRVTGKTVSPSSEGLNRVAGRGPPSSCEPHEAGPPLNPEQRRCPALRRGPTFDQRSAGASLIGTRAPHRSEIGQWFPAIHELGALPRVLPSWANMNIAGRLHVASAGSRASGPSSAARCRVPSPS
jgi:hypothetical protein